MAASLHGKGNLSLLPGVYKLEVAEPDALGRLQLAACTYVRVASTMSRPVLVCCLLTLHFD